jgi:cytochrome c oxidase subunit 2
MNSPVVVMEPADFDAWLVGQQGGAEGSTGDAVARGEELATSMGCISCHSTDGTQLVGPTWQGLFGREVTLEDGTTVTADEEYLRQAILDPNAQIVQGFAPAMPAYEGMLTEEQISDLIAYIQTLE